MKTSSSLRLTMPVLWIFPTETLALDLYYVSFLLIYPSMSLMITKEEMRFIALYCHKRAQKGNTKVAFPSSVAKQMNATHSIRASLCEKKINIQQLKDNPFSGLFNRKKLRMAHKNATICSPMAASRP